MAKPAPSSQTPIQKEENAAAISNKDWISWGIALFAALIAFAGFVLSWLLYKKNTALAEQRRSAELRAEDEHRKRTGLEERQRKAEDQLAQLQAAQRFQQQQEQREQSETVKTAEERYLATLKNEACKIYLAAPGAEGVEVSLAETFVHLRISEHYRSEAFPQWDAPRRALEEDADLSPQNVIKSAFQDHGRKVLLIVGDPGSGKTTLLHYYVMCCLQPLGHRELGFSQAVFPLYLPLREVDSEASLPQNLAKWAGKYDPEIPGPVFQTWLQERDTLVLLDGLDEVRSLDDRKKVCHWLGYRTAGLQRARFVVTSRGDALRAEDNLPLPASLLRADVRDFTAEQKREFLLKWFPAAYLRSGAPREHETKEQWQQRQLREAAIAAQQVIDYIEDKDNRSVRELAGIPMLLQLLALIWKQYKTKPESRTKLYDVALDYLLEYRDDQRGLTPLLKADKALRLLCPAALWMQEELRAEEVSKHKLHEYIRPLLEPINNTLTAEALCENLRERAGVIANYGQNEYVFRHKSFREYFAGLQLAANYSENDRLARLAGTFGDSAWAEPLRYFMSRADRKAFSAFMNAFFHSPASSELTSSQQDLLQTLVREAAEKPPEALLACLRDESKNENQRRYALDCLKTIAGERVREELTAFVVNNFGKKGLVSYAAEIVAQLSPPPPTAKAAAPALRSVLAQRPKSFRNPVEYNAEYILIPGGTINYSVTKKIEKVPDVYFAKYPVTNKQYRRFIRYLQNHEAELSKLLAPEIFAQKLLEFAGSDRAYLDYLVRGAKAWPEKLKSNYDEDRKFNGEDQPVVGVSWYAARAYCLWLSIFEHPDDVETFRRNVSTAIYRLPQEIEWERAAAGRLEDGSPRPYPWGDKSPDQNLANYGNKVGQTTPANRYPEGATPEGLMDMAGNVWEWQENLFGHEKYPEARALRGGSWDLDPHYLRCAARNYYHPDFQWDNGGFRLVCAQSFFDTLKL